MIYYMPQGGGRTMKRSYTSIAVILIALIIVGTFTSCTEKKAAPGTSTPGTAASPVKTIQSEAEFKQVIQSSADRLLVFDLYADWCGPCRILSPMLEEIAGEHKAKADFYKIDVDRHPRLAAAFKARGIPHVSFIKNRTIVHTFVGVQPKSAYVRAVNMLAGEDEGKKTPEADGEIIGGIRVIRFKAGIDPRSIYVYRGETVTLVMEEKDFPFSVHIPDFKISQKSEKGQGLEITFKAENTGVYPIFCNGRCPAGDGALHGEIVVMQYETRGEAQFTELAAAGARQMIEESEPLILDVRTPREFYDGHIKNAKLLPLQQLEQRISEIEDYKNKDIIIYCRSGNRSTVAGEILIRQGFKKIHNIRSGIRGWLKEGFEIEKAEAEAVL
jgi:thioredoxin